MGVPKQLEKAAQEADELYEKTYAKKDGNEGEGETGQDPAPPAEPSAADTPQATATTEPPPEAPAAPSAGDETFEQKWKTLQGIHRADVERANATINELRQALEDTTKKLREGTSVPSGDAHSEPTDPPVNVAEGRERIREEYGQEFLDDMHGEITSPLKKEIAELKQQIADLSQVTHQGANEKFIDALRKAVPDQEQLVQDPNFKAWLQQPDDMSGIRRFDLARDAEKKRDVKRLAKFYDQYRKVHGNNGSPAPEPASPPANGGETPVATPPAAPSKEDLLAPGSTGGTAQPTGEGEVEYVKTSEIERFSRDITAGKFRGRDAEQAEIQRKIDLAQASRRIIVDT